MYLFLLMLENKLFGFHTRECLIMSHSYTEKVKMLYVIAQCQKKAILTDLSKLRM